MERTHINPAALHRFPAMPRAVRVSGSTTTLYCSGMTPADREYRAVHVGDLRAQYEQVKADCGMVLDEAGADWSDVVSVRTYVRDMDAFVKLHREGLTSVPGDAGKPPCSTVIEVSRLSDPDFLVEMEVVAVIPDE